VSAPRASTPPPAANPQQSASTSPPALPSDPLFPDDLTDAGAGTPAPEGDTLNTPPAIVVGADGNQTQRLAVDTPLDKGPIGLLAIIATVCVVGVTAGAIRAIITQRATRVEFA
jgi:hypothetical protein